MRPSFGVLLLWALVLDVVLLWPTKTPTRLQPSQRRLCAIPVERVGVGVRCLSPVEAKQLAVTAGDVVPLTVRGVRLVAPPKRMAGERQLALGLRIDPNRATEEELMALPDVGPALAQAIMLARQRAPLRSEADLIGVRGFGEKRLAKLCPYLVFPDSQ